MIALNTSAAWYGTVPLGERGKNLTGSLGIEICKNIPQKKKHESFQEQLCARNPKARCGIVSYHGKYGSVTPQLPVPALLLASRKHQCLPAFLAVPGRSPCVAFPIKLISQGAENAKGVRPWFENGLRSLRFGCQSPRTFHRVHLDHLRVSDVQGQVMVLTQPVGRQRFLSMQSSRSQPQ